jgi:hypothetical protein
VGHPRRRTGPPAPTLGEPDLTGQLLSVESRGRRIQ